MKKNKIQCIDEAVSIVEESSIIRGDATMNGDAKTNNKYVPVQNRALEVTGGQTRCYKAFYPFAIKI